MPLTTDINAIPYPENGDTTNYPTAFSNLADSIDRVIVPRFASIAARNAAIPSPTNGMIAFTTLASGAMTLQMYRNSAWVDISWSNTVYKTALTSRASTTTKTADPDLAFFAQANSTYIIECILMAYNTGIATANLSYNLSAPAGTTGDMTTIQTPQGETSAVRTMQTFATVAYTGTFVMAAPVASTRPACSDFRAKLTTSGTAGNISVAWAQQSSSANPTVLAAGSYMRYTKIA